MGDKALCFIPARGGSKRLPRKNIRLLNGKPLLQYTIEAAAGSGLFSDIVVSSDDHEILELSESLGVNTDVRPEAMSGDTVRAVHVLEEYLNREENTGKYNIVANMLPTCPFRTAEDVKKAFEVYKSMDKSHVLIGVTEYDFPPQLELLQKKNSSVMKMSNPDQYINTTRSQDIGKSYHPNGSIYLCTVERFMKEKTFFIEPVAGYIMPPERSFDIDYEYQFNIADIMMRESNK